jgi:hypothetical protein
MVAWGMYSNSVVVKKVECKSWEGICSVLLADISKCRLYPDWPNVDKYEVSSHALLTELYHSDNLISHNNLTKSDIYISSHQIGSEKQDTESISVAMPSSSLIHHMQSPGIIASNVLDQFLPSISTTTSDHFQSTERTRLEYMMLITSLLKCPMMALSLNNTV